jgi:hypothetical protein
MFRCPHCRQRTIGKWAKLKASGWWPSACPRCGGKYVPAAWGQLPALAAFFTGLLLPLAIARSATWTVAMLLLAGGLVLGLLASAAVYLLITPLLRHGSAAARWEWWSFAGVIALLAIYAFLNGAPEPASGEVVSARKLFELRSASPPPGAMEGSMTISQVEPELHQELKAALSKAGVRFTVETMPDGREAVRLRPDQYDAYFRVERQIWGEPPPHDGRSVHFSSDAAKRDFQQWLSDAGIAHRIVTYQRKDYVVWDGEPHVWKKFHAERPSDCAKPRAQLDTAKRC